MKQLIFIILCLAVFTSCQDSKEQEAVLITPTQLSVEQLKDSVAVNKAAAEDAKKVADYYTKLINNAQTWDELQSVGDSIKNIKKAFDKYSAKHKTYKKAFTSEGEKQADSIQPLLEKRIKELKH